MNSHRCPLATSDNELIRSYLADLPLDDLVFLSEQVFFTLSPAEQISYDLNGYCSDYADCSGRADFITSLVDDGVITPIQIPLSYRRNERLVSLIRSPVYEYYIPIAHELKDEPAPLTDEFESTTGPQVVTSPQKNSSPCYEVLLMDEAQQPVCGVGVNFNVDGVSTTVVSDKQGRARLDGEPGSSTFAQVTFPGSADTGNLAQNEQNSSPGA